MEITAESFKEWVDTSYPEYKDYISYNVFSDASINIHNLGIRVRDFLNKMGKNISDMELYAFKNPKHISLIFTVGGLIMDMGFDIKDTGEIVYEYVIDDVTHNPDKNLRYDFRETNNNVFADKVISFIYKLGSVVN